MKYVWYPTASFALSQTDSIYLSVWDTWIWYLFNQCKAKHMLYLESQENSEIKKTWTYFWIRYDTNVFLGN